MNTKTNIKFTYQIENQYTSERMFPTEVEFDLTDQDEIDSIVFLDESNELKRLINDTVELLNKNDKLHTENDEWEYDDNEVLLESIQEQIGVDTYDIYLNKHNSNFVMCETDEGMILAYEVSADKWAVIYNFPGDYMGWDIAYYVIEYKLSINDK